MLSLIKNLIRNLSEKSLKNELEELSQDIRKRVFETLEPINEKTAPKEIRPLICAINQLISYFEDRSHHEQDFTANASHELRTPLAGIRLQTEIAMNTENINIQKKAHQNVLTAIDENERLIEQLLILARLTADRVVLSKEKINLGLLAANVIANLKSLAVEKRINLTLHAREGITLFASNESISILLNNLIRNAINHTPENGKILVKINTLKKHIYLSVRDNGPGIPIDEYDRVVQRFQKISANNNTGSGLGLAIVKRICDLHAAKLIFDRNPIQAGLKVSIVFKA